VTAKTQVVWVNHTASWLTLTGLGPFFVVSIPPEGPYGQYAFEFDAPGTFQWAAYPSQITQTRMRWSGTVTVTS
jgi:hypothetical protein